MRAAETMTWEKKRLMLTTIGYCIIKRNYKIDYFCSVACSFIIHTVLYFHNFIIFKIFLYHCMVLWRSIIILSPKNSNGTSVRWPLFLLLLLLLLFSVPIAFVLCSGPSSCLARLYFTLNVHVVSCPICTMCLLSIVLWVNHIYNGPVNLELHGGSGESAFVSYHISHQHCFIE